MAVNLAQIVRPGGGNIGQFVPPELAWAGFPAPRAKRPACAPAHAPVVRTHQSEEPEPRSITRRRRKLRQPRRTGIAVSIRRVLAAAKPALDAGQIAARCSQYTRRQIASSVGMMVSLGLAEATGACREYRYRLSPEGRALARAEAA